MNNDNDTEIEFVFIPVSVNRGRKFRGNAYSIESEVQYCSGNWAYSSWSVKLWDPVNLKYVYANPDFVETRDCKPEQIESDRNTYVMHIINDTIAWCMSKTSNEAEGKKFARNVLLKHHSELKDYINKVLPDNRDVVTEVEKTLRWAINLRTRPCIMYGHNCKGGKTYSKTETVRKAWSALHNKGITELDGFKEAWIFMTKSFDLPDYGIKIDTP